MTDPLDARRRRLHFRAWHRGTKEADIMIGSFTDRHLAGWGEAEIAWMEAFLEEDDVEIMAWAIGSAEALEPFRTRASAEADAWVLEELNALLSKLGG